MFDWLGIGRRWNGIERMQWRETAFQMLLSMAMVEEQSGIETEIEIENRRLKEIATREVAKKEGQRLKRMKQALS